MIEVRLELWDAVERGMFNSFVDVLEAQRDQAEAERERKWALAAADAGRDSADVAPVVVEECSGTPADAAAQLAHLMDVKVSIVPTPAELMAAVTAHFNKHGIQATRALVAEYGSGRVTEMKLPDEKLAELYVRLTA
jgi:hypothetical protein